MLNMVKKSKLIFSLYICATLLVGFLKPAFALNAPFTEGCADRNAVNSAIGCIPINDMTALLTFFLKFALGISGGVVLVMFIVTSYAILTSAGDPQKLQAAKENIVSIFSGLILIAFSLVLLQTIGSDILGLPTF